MSLSEVLTLDLVVISTRHKQRLLLMEVNSTDRAFMLIKSVNECPHAVIPELPSGKGPPSVLHDVTVSQLDSPRNSRV